MGQPCPCSIDVMNFNEWAFLSDVSGIDREQIPSETDDINALVNYWISIFSLVINKHAPICEMFVSEKYYPWIDKELKGLMRRKDRLRKSAAKSKFKPLRDSYRQVLNSVNSLSIQLNKEYSNKKISACKGNFKESRKTINKLLNKRSKSSNIDILKGSGLKLFTKRNFLM